MEFSGLRSDCLSCWMGHFAGDEVEETGWVGRFGMFSGVALCMGHEAGGRDDDPEPEPEPEPEADEMAG